MEEKKLHAEQRDKDRQFQLEKEKTELEQEQMTTSMQEKNAVERSQFERKKTEAKEKIAVIKEKEKLAVKLPKFNLKKYSANILKWTEFWDAFEAIIHNNKILHAVDKLNYLKGQLCGNASKVLSGPELTKDNYYVAGELLKGRHGKKTSYDQCTLCKDDNLLAAAYKAASLRSV